MIGFYYVLQITVGFVDRLIVLIVPSCRMVRGVEDLLW